MYGNQCRRRCERQSSVNVKIACRIVNLNHNNRCRNPKRQPHNAKVLNPNLNEGKQMSVVVIFVGSVQTSGEGGGGKCQATAPVTSLASAAGRPVTGAYYYYSFFSLLRHIRQHTGTQTRTAKIHQKYICSVPVLFFSRPRSEGWPHHGRTFSIYPCPLSF